MITARVRLGLPRGLPSGLSQIRGYAFQAEKPSEIKKLVFPVGQDEQPSIYANSGIDTRTLQERKKDFMDLEKNKQRRIELKNELAKSSFQAIYDFRDTGGKFFTSPSTAWSGQSAKYMPNFRGLTLDKRETGSLEFLGKTTTIVRIFSSSIGFKQIDTYSKVVEGVPKLDLNMPTSWFNMKLVQWFSGRVKRSLGVGDNYLICRKGVTQAVRDSIWASNELGGYFYVVDKAGKIRWAASGPATENDLTSLRGVLKELEK